MIKTVVNTELEKGRFNDQVVGKSIVRIGGKLTATGAEIIAAKNGKGIEDITERIISIQCGSDDNEGRV